MFSRGLGAFEFKTGFPLCTSSLASDSTTEIDDWLKWKLIVIGYWQVGRQAGKEFMREMDLVEVGSEFLTVFAYFLGLAPNSFTKYRPIEEWSFAELFRYEPPILRVRDLFVASAWLLAQSERKHVFFPFLKGLGLYVTCGMYFGSFGEFISSLHRISWGFCYFSSSWYSICKKITKFVFCNCHEIWKY